MNIKQKLVYITSFAAVLIFLFSVLIPSVFALKNDTSAINWQPSKINVEIFKGAGRIIDVQFTSSETIDGVELFIVPEIRPYIKILNQSFSSHINADEINSLRLLFSIPNNIPLTFVEGTVHLRQNNKTISKPLPITINIFDPLPAVKELENYLLTQFGTSEPPIGSIINPPQEIIDALSIGSNLPLIFKSGLLNFVGYLPPENGTLKNSVSNLINLLSEKTLNTLPLINTLNNTVYTEDVSSKTVIPYGANAVTFYIGPSPQLLSPLKWMDTNGDNKIDTFVLILDSSIHTVLRASDIENIKNNLFFKNNSILSQSAKTIFHELIHAMNFNSQCNGLSWLISDNEEFYSIYLESLFTDIISSDFVGIDFNYNQASDIISPNLTCLEILNIIPPQAVILNEPNNITQTSLDLSWSQNYDIDFRFYRIYRSRNPNVNFGATLVTEIDDQTQTLFTDTNLQAGTTYYYKIFVFDKGGLSEGSNEIKTITAQGKPIWPMFHYDSKHTGRAPYLGIETPKIKWTFNTPGLVFDEPVIGTDGTVYFVDWSNRLSAINRETGEMKWSIYIESWVAPYTPAIGSDETIYVGGNKVYAIDPDGTIRWIFEDPMYNFWNSSPILDNEGIIYLTSFFAGPGVGNTKLFAINPDGSLKWKKDIATEDFQNTQSSSIPTISDDGIIYLGARRGHPYYDSKLLAFSPNGDILWSLKLQGSLSQISIAPDGIIYTVGWDWERSTLYAINSSGILKWSLRPISLPDWIGSLMSVDSTGNIYLGSKDGKFISVNPEGVTRWIIDLGATVCLGAIDKDDNLYVKSRYPNYFISSITNSGIIRWKLIPSNIEDITSCPILDDKQNIYIATNGILWQPKLFSISNQ